MTATIDLSGWLTTAEAARRLGRSVKTVRNLARQSIIQGSQEVAEQKTPGGRTHRLLVSPAWLRAHSGTVRGRWVA